ncbi:keratin-3, type I cytoskeletal 51 kDa-like [Schistocerca piceifrons]|uniref:keratin-3, type I cytoskeletal 51 kDa-like n=1 Tax=Schistocerca piceifrons TaxID=274613 RepID=UPI001F5F7BFA|nr:keratin-3, type I cytoskeletal 51 kDa-like [Schistocerca piceifrons]
MFQLVDLHGGGGLHHGAALLALGGGGHGFPLGQPELVELGPVGEPSVQIIEADVPPPKTIRVTKTVAVGVPVPYPVRNDVPVPRCLCLLGSYGPSGGGIAASASGLSAVNGGSYGGGYSAGGGDYSGGIGGGGGLDAAAALAAAGIGHNAGVGLAEAHPHDLGAAASGGNSEEISRSATAIVGEETIQRAIDAAEAIEQGNKVPDH